MACCCIKMVAASTSYPAAQLLCRSSCCCWFCLAPAALCRCCAAVGLVAVVCAVTLTWAARDARRRGFLTLRSYPYVVPTVLLGAFKAMTYVYPGVASAAVGIFSCKHLDRPASMAGEVVAAQGTFWSKVGLSAVVTVATQSRVALGIYLYVHVLACSNTHRQLRDMQLTHQAPWTQRSIRVCRMCRYLGISPVLSIAHSYRLTELKLTLLAAAFQHTSQAFAPPSLAAQATRRWRTTAAVVHYLTTVFSATCRTWTPNALGPSMQLLP